MSKKHRGGPGPIPPGNRPQSGPPTPTREDENEAASRKAEGGAGFEEQDPKRRLGDYGGAGEHPRQQPGRLNDGDTHSQ
jgi:hypothetical protein